MWSGRGYRWMYYLTGLPRWARTSQPWPRCFWFPWLPMWWWAGIYPQPITKEDEVKMLQEEAAALEEELKAIRKRLQELEK
ncbi:MAG: DUF5320 family protein [Halobacteria archaeon]